MNVKSFRMNNLNDIDLLMYSFFSIIIFCFFFYNSEISIESKWSVRNPHAQWPDFRKYCEFVLFNFNFLFIPLNINQNRSQYYIVFRHIEESKLFCFFAYFCIFFFHDKTRNERIRMEWKKSQLSCIMWLNERIG